jgi:hypothetical protein
MKRESVYVRQLKELILQIQIKAGQKAGEARDLLTRAARWECPSKEERILLDEVIFKAQEFIDLEQRMNEKKCSEREAELDRSYRSWFSSLDMLIKTFEVPLNKISFSDMSLKE